MILAVEVVAHSIQMGQLLLTMSRGRGVPRDILPAQGTCLAASNILASLTLLHIKWNWSPLPWPDLEMNAPALRVFTVRCHKPTCPHTSPSCDPTPGAHMYTNQWLQHTHINTTGSSLWPVVSWKLWFKEGKRSVKTSWWNPELPLVPQNRKKQTPLSPNNKSSQHSFPMYWLFHYIPVFKKEHSTAAANSTRIISLFFTCTSPGLFLFSTTKLSKFACR